MTLLGFRLLVSLFLLEESDFFEPLLTKVSSKPIIGLIFLQTLVFLHLYRFLEVKLS